MFIEAVCQLQCKFNDIRAEQIHIIKIRSISIQCGNVRHLYKLQT